MFSSSSVLLLSESSSCSSPGYPASVPIHDHLDLERYHPSDLLFILQSIYTPITHLLPVVHLRIVIKMSPYNISLCVCESFRNRKLDPLYPPTPMRKRLILVARKGSSGILSLLPLAVMMPPPVKILVSPLAPMMVPTPAPMMMPPPTAKMVPPPVASPDPPRAEKHMPLGVLVEYEGTSTRALPRPVSQSIAVVLADYVSQACIS